MNVCKCIVSSWYSRRAASPLMRLVAGKERWEATDSPSGCSSKLGWNRAKSYCHLHGAQGATANDRRTSSPLP
ncbi:hypothetical protein TNCV_2206601 [Trichonephila clavipes]|uniref:Uncharacterized protein n=1 Tax=Trichonephila clavipes TaxID=2585209 RepID=A0A8X6VF79_TRICX|nr:hypothetical protein TNCV_2206601 [Trichonephila clavipes]